MEAAIYIGISPTKFDEMVFDGRMPKPRHIDVRRVWDIRALDDAFDGLPGEGGTEASNIWDSLVDIVPAPRTSTMQTNGRQPRTRPSLDCEPEIRNALAQQCYRRYEVGELDNRPMGKREQAALRMYYEARNQPLSYFKGAGLDTNDRLEARGFVAVAQDRGDRVPFYRITSAGEAAWLARCATASD